MTVPDALLSVADVEQHDAKELEASRRVMVERLGRQITWIAARHGFSQAEVADHIRAPLPSEPEDQPPESVTWLDLESALDADPTEGAALWERVKNEARHELRTGIRMATSLEQPLRGSPFDRAQFLAIQEALTQALRPGDGLELLLIQQMAAAYEQHLRWQMLAVQRVQEDVWQGERDRRRALEQMSPRQRTRAEEDGGWLPPRLGQAQSIEQATVLADRYQRAFVRLLRALREHRRLFDAIVVAGGQVNIADKQVNLASGSKDPGHSDDIG
jgi:hypothetical protein